jgi:hypothetical protein
MVNGCIYLLIIQRRCKTPWRLVARVAKFYMVAPYIFIIIIVAFSLYKKMCYLVTCIEQKTTDNRIVGPQCGTSFMSSLWRLEFGAGY